nr:sigma-70 family RNA polymerase sigma factor [Ligilactobacillus salivarius]
MYAIFFSKGGYGVNLNLDNILLENFKEQPSDDNFNKLFQKYTPLVFKLINSYHFTFYERDDLIQEAKIVCYSSALRYRLPSNITFGYYFQINLRNKYNSLYRLEHAYKRKSEKESTSYEQLSSNLKEVVIGSDYKNHAPDKNILVKEAIQAFLHSLDEKNCRLFRDIISGKVQKEDILQDSKLRYRYYKLKNQYKNNVFDIFFK